MARERVSVFGRAKGTTGHGVESRGVFWSRFGGAGGGIDNRARFRAKKSPATPRHSTMRDGGAPAFFCSDSGRCFLAAFRRFLRGLAFSRFGSGPELKVLILF